MAFEIDWTNSRGQVAIFILIAIVIVAAILFLFLSFGRTDIDVDKGVNPALEIMDCAEEAVEEITQTLLQGGGSVAPFHNITYDSKAYNYLCYQDAFYETCINRFPGLEIHFENEIKERSKAEIQNCFDNVRIDFEDRGFGVDGGSTRYSVDIIPSKILINLEKEITISQDGTAQSFKKFDTEILSEAEQLISITRKAINDESEYCNFDYLGQMIIFPTIKITKNDFNSSKLYSVASRVSREDLLFAVRGCALPPGI